MPAGWIADVQRRIRAIDRERVVRVRPHPGGNPSRRTLEQDLRGAAVCVIWGSGAGLKALAAGVPVVYEFDRWIGREGGSRGLKTLRQPHLGDRDAMLRRVLDAQWTDEEVATGIPFRELTR
jgi:hypothetical protein